MTKTNLRILLFIFIGVILITPYLSKAQSDVLKSALNEVLEQSVNVEIENAEARRGILLKVLNLSGLEATELKNNLKNLGDLEEGYSDLKDQFLTELADYLDYYKSLKNELTPDLSLDEIRALAGEFKDWRESYYDEEVKKIVNFILVFQQEKTLKIAERRSEKISKDLAKIKSSRIKTEAVRLLDEAKIDLKEARGLNELAKKSFLPMEDEELETVTIGGKILSEETKIDGLTVSSTATTTEVSTTTSTSSEEVFEKRVDIKELAESALAKIKEAYLNFFRVSALIKKL